MSAPSPTVQRSTLEPPRFTQPKPPPSPSPQEAPYQQGQQPEQRHKSAPPTLTAQRLYEDPLHHFALPTNMQPLPLPKRAAQPSARWSWALSAFFVLTTLTLSALWWRRAPEPSPCAISASPSSPSSSLEVLTPPPRGSLERLEAEVIERPCLPEERGGCEGQVMRCALPALLAQRDPLSAGELSLCQQAGGCEGLRQAIITPNSDVERSGLEHTQEVERGGCQASSREACVVYERARQYCAWRGLDIPTINAWERIKTARALSVGQPYWVVSPYGVGMISLTLSSSVEAHPSQASLEHELKLAEPNERAVILCVREL